MLSFVYLTLGALTFGLLSGTCRQPLSHLITNPLIVGAAGAITLNGADLASFWHHLFNGHIISNTSLGKMKEMKDGYGFGLFQMPFGARQLYTHNGGSGRLP